MTPSVGSEREPAEVLVATRGLSVAYGVVTALRSVDLDIRRGRVATLLGANGAGKTTLLRAITGLLPHHGGRITAGRIEYPGAVMGRISSGAVVRHGVAQVMEGRRLFAQLTVEENLYTGATSLPRRERKGSVEELLDRFPLLAERRTERAGLLSGGQQQIVAIARALASRPRVLILDEPSLGLAPLAVLTVRDLIAELARDGQSILLVEQNVTMAMELADDVYVLERGSMRTTGTPAGLRADEVVAELYLGGGGLEGAATKPSHDRAPEALPWLQ